MSPNLLALLDCNNFFVSCERIFQPKFSKVPVAVLSSNDGCIIARSEEVKKLGIPMGAPYFKYQELFERHQVKIFSSNFSLYGDISQRVMQVLQELCWEVEIYSIDEAFFSLEGIQEPLVFCKKIQKVLWEWIGIPVSIGIASTKVLAKIANKIAKNTPSTEGVFCLEEDSFLKNLPVEEVWGIGRRLSKKLPAEKIFTAYQLKKADPFFLQKRFSVVLAKIIYELNGIGCLPLEIQYQKRKSLMVSKSFGVPLQDLSDIEESLANYVTKAAEKLRKEQQMAKHVKVFLSPQTRAQNTPNNSLQMELCLSYHTDCTFSLVKAALSALQKIYLPGTFYRKVGILLFDLIDTQDHPQDLLDKRDLGKTRRVLTVMDQINQKYGKNTIRPAKCYGKQKGRVKAAYSSPRFTTHFEELFTVR